MESPSVSGPTRPCCLAPGQVPRMGLWGEALPLVRKADSGQLGQGVDTLTAGESLDAVWRLRQKSVCCRLWVLVDSRLDKTRSNRNKYGACHMQVSNSRPRL